MSYIDLYTQGEYGVPIMYNTTVHITMEHIQPDIPIINPSVNQWDYSLSRSRHDSLPMQDCPQDVMNIAAKIATPLKVVLSKDVYEQILQTTDNLTYNEYEFMTNVEKEVRRPASEPLLSSKAKSDIHLSVSALKLEQLEKSSSTTKIPTMTGVKEKVKTDKDMVTKLKFEVPLFNVEMRGDFGEGEQGLVDLRLHDFYLKYEKSNDYSTAFEVSLKSLIMEDLLEKPDSSHRLLMVSKAPGKEDTEEFHMRPKEFLSTSCPDSTIITPVPSMPSSLPSSFHQNLSSSSGGSYTHGGTSKPIHVLHRPGVPPGQRSV